MPDEFVTTVAIIGISALVLHIKSHLKFIVLGLYIGIVLAETVGGSVYESLSPRIGWLSESRGLNIVQLVLLLVPTLILGFNHSLDKKHWSFAKNLVFVLTTSLLLVSSVVHYLPAGLHQNLVGRSLIIFQLSQLYVPLVVGGAGLILVDSFHHKKSSKIAKLDSKNAK